MIAGEDIKAGMVVYVEPTNGKLYAFRTPTRWSVWRNRWRWIVWGKGAYNLPIGILVRDLKKGEDSSGE